MTTYAPRVRRLWALIPRQDWASGENWRQHTAVAYRIQSQGEAFDRRVRKFAAGVGCHAAVEAWDSGMWWPCPWTRRKALGSRFCWRHEHHEDEEGQMPPTTTKRTVDIEDESECKSFEVTVHLGEITWDSLNRKMTKFRSALREMDAPGDAVIRFDTYQTRTDAVVRWTE